MNDQYPVVMIRLSILAGQFNAGAGIASWCFGMKGKLFYSTSPHEQELLRFLKISGCLDYALSDDRSCMKPVILSNTMGMIWAADYVWEKEEDRLTERPAFMVVIGPIFSSTSSMRAVEEHLNRMGLSQPAMIGMRQILREIPIMSMNNFRQYVAMLHFTNIAAPVSRDDVEYQSSMSDDSDEEDKPNLELVREMEEQIYQSIRNGSVCFKEILDDTPSMYMPKKDVSCSEKEMRDVKNMLIAHTARCASAALSAGVSSHTVHQIELRYRQKIEQSSLLSQLTDICREMRTAFAECVARLRAALDVSVPVQTCRDYLDAHLREDIQLSDLAAMTGYSEYYLTKKFYAEMGIRLSDYIRKKRIEYAKVLLLTTNRTIDDICERMGFASRSHFSRVFTQIVGQSPGSFRSQNQAAGGKRE